MIDRRRGLLGVLLIAGMSMVAPLGAGGAGIQDVRLTAQPTQDDFYLVVSISERVVRVFSGDRQIRSYPIAVGQPEWPTPTGEFTIHQIDFNPDWNPPDSDWAEGRESKAPGDPDNPMGRVRMSYQRTYSLHGTDDLQSLGHAESHGSIRLANEDIMELAPLVMEAGGEPRSESWFEEVFANETEMVQVSLPNPVPLTNVE